jgi:Homeodomain-like domain
VAGTGLGKHDAKLIAELAAGASHDRAAIACGCSPRTVRRRLADPRFRAGLDDARRQLFEAAFSRVTAAGQAAAATLISLLSRETPPAVRLGASRTLLESCCKFRETHELEERLRALEERLGKVS